MIRSGLSGLLLALASFTAYWWQWQSLGETQARALALVVLLAGYQTLMFAERVALPGLAVDRVPRTRVFWAVWFASLLSLVLILYVDVVAATFRVSVPAGKHLAAAVAAGVLSVSWRLRRRD